MGESPVGTDTRLSIDKITRLLTAFQAILDWS